ncbi:MAG TPA: DUF3565 domain-containing protein [Candidatus Cybelea sp.]|nr:DUF3565 domain-containing protein [Candidatus Cybelea sp.]
MFSCTLELMPYQNRVTPFGTLVANAARGALTGNRGILHDEHGNLGRARWRGRMWIACVLRFKDRKRPVMQPGRYTHLFFLDEATALAAGHRPCFECRNRDAKAFMAAWMRANRPGAAYPGVGEVDRQLHGERVRRGCSKVTFESRLGLLPDGCFVAGADLSETAWLIWRGKLHRWSPTGYVAHEPIAADRRVNVLTPRSIVAALGAGYRPSVHGSADTDAAGARRIVGFRRDESGDWVADLECGHTQHMRNNPPWSERPWVETAAGRREHFGMTVPCRKCERGEAP